MGLGRTEGQTCLPHSAGHTALIAAQEVFVFMGCEYTLLGYIELPAHQHLQDLLRAAHNPFSTLPVFVLGITLIQVQDLLLYIVDLLELCMYKPHIYKSQSNLYICTGACSALGAETEHSSLT